MRIYVPCEESQEVCKALRKLGHEAYSGDVQDCSGGHPEWHIKDDAIRHLNDGWDGMVAFPPCTRLAVSGARWFKLYPEEQKQAIRFFMRFAECEIPLVAIENPIGIMSTKYRKPDQIIQPWQFGHGETKATCLWLKGLPLLKPTNIVTGRENRIHKMPPSKDRGKLRSKTYHGIAEAMANQWFNPIKEVE
jgi:hypothetical protein